MKQDLLLGKPFNNNLWRHMLSDALKEIDVKHAGLQVIAPWGFEVISKKFLYGNIRRFYCYIGSPKKDQYRPQEVKQNFANSINLALSKLTTDMYNDLACIVTAGNNEIEFLLNLRPEGYNCRPNDKLICIEYKETENILYDYANYMILSLLSLYHKNGELDNYENNRFARNRLFQLYLIQENLYKDFIRALSPSELDLYRKIQPILDNSFQEIYSKNGAIKKINSLEEKLTNELITPRINLILEFLKTSNAPKKHISCTGYHTSLFLSVDMPKNIYDLIFNKIVDSYNNYL